MFYDNRRIIDNHHYSVDRLFDSRPAPTGDVVELNRFISKLNISTRYHKTMAVKKYSYTYKNVMDIVVRNFVRALFSNDFNISIKYFNNYKELSGFINNYDARIRITPNKIAQLKHR